MNEPNNKSEPLSVSDTRENSLKNLQQSDLENQSEEPDPVYDTLDEPVVETIVIIS